MKSGCAKDMRSRNFLGEGGVKVIWRNPDLTGFSLMMASLTSKCQEKSQMSMQFQRDLIFNTILSGCKMPSPTDHRNTNLTEIDFYSRFQNILCVFAPKFQLL